MKRFSTYWLEDTAVTKAEALRRAQQDVRATAVREPAVLGRVPALGRAVGGRWRWAAAVGGVHHPYSQRHRNSGPQENE